jgi:replicative DNA helicase
MDIAEIIIGKQRNGPVGSICLAFMRETGRFFPVEVSPEPLPAASGGT